MKLSWYGTAAVMLESDGYRLVFDPFLGIPLNESLCRRKLRAIKFRTADAVLVTHGHFDHILDIPRLYKDADVKIHATITPCQTLIEHDLPKEKLKLIAPGVSFQLGGFKIRVYQGRHCRFDAGIVMKTVFKKETLLHPKRLYELIKLNRRFDENRETLFYEIEAEGKRIQLMGSMGLDIDTLYPTGADVLILPFQGTGDPARTVKPIINKLEPKSIFLDHYDDTFPPMSSRIETALFTYRLTKEGIPTAAMEFGKVYEI
ncbi:MAG: MBL fold metallo-hydrolase [Ruminococcus sp.]|uniref:MBL fold metallo-hydrolase n=1 Tax=Ruminococcus sp. TaxID=41978 RepID=UPI002872AEBA|nr:MBL fold metallo-hydrolase [Ruminococcus sp.]MBQ3284538.1 MBL fold metallo-hydrolase [Ruminococcus sp.]